MKTTIATVFSLCLAAQVFAAEGLKITSQTKYLDQGKTENSEIYLSGDKVMMKEDQSQVIFDTDKESFTYVDHKKKEVLVVTKEEIMAMKQQMKSAMSAMEQQLQALPPQQREMMKERMGGMMGGTEEEKSFSFEKTGSESINGWSTTAYDALESGNKVGEFFIADFSTLNVSESDFEPMKKMAKFFSETFADMAKGFKNNASNMFSFSTEESPLLNEGFPVKFISYENGSAEIESSMQSIEKQSFDSGLFEAPKGYKKTTMEEMMQNSFR